MKRLSLVMLMALVALAALMWAMGREASAAEVSPSPSDGMSIEAFVWRFGEDYPGTKGDSELPLDTVYIKTNDGENWQSKYDKSPNAVSGPESLRALVQMYHDQGIRTIAWYVPKGNEYQAQIDNAKAVLDTGVDALYVDVEPYEGFCFKDCAALADNVWKPLRAERPDATLGLIYDPRPKHRDTSAVASWMSVSNVALPMCYWNDFTTAPWNSPSDCIKQAYDDLASVVPGPVTYVPIVPGTAHAEEVQIAMNTITSLGGDRMSLWRRGVVTSDVWSMLERTRAVPTAAPPAVEPPAVQVDPAAAPVDPAVAPPLLVPAPTLESSSTSGAIAWCDHWGIAPMRWKAQCSWSRS